MEWEDWFEELLDKANDNYGEHVAKLVRKAPFMYEDYHEQNMSPEEALVAEWGA